MADRLPESLLRDLIGQLPRLSGSMWSIDDVGLREATNRALVEMRDLADEAGRLSQKCLNAKRLAQRTLALCDGNANAAAMARRVIDCLADDAHSASRPAATGSKENGQ